MKAWNLKVKSNPKEISKKLESALGSVNGFVFNMNDDKNDSVTFKVRKRVLYAWYMIYLNYIIVNGKISKTDTENETNVEISFTQHFLMTLIIFTNMLFGLGFLIMTISGISNSVAMYITGGILLAIGIVLWIELKKRSDRKVQEYKTLISEILEF
ncbi:DUF423 domain-containing protein [Sinomicrobium weinanense]|uniref:DUF423 domain-containing protein n=1 Tax=Sinomicrobium weinanense TaxID=2842200 RepID=A0A926Q3S1_9FLAO|nr:DUF423 domain-containing protein [Sinomicrobium weinanense]MBC9796301.1 DUF423 domain-containing protein [Sinomicrobium weinanense]MBU3123218.1 DUF423 domain-containing protein [Sinomicrobium weinanense]